MVTHCLNPGAVQWQQHYSEGDSESELVSEGGSEQGSTLAVFRYPENPRFPDGIPDSPEQ